MQNSVTKLPRHILADITGNNNQAIKAFENLELSATVTLPEQIALISGLVEMANSNALQAMMMANQLLSQSQQNIPPVGVNVANDGYLPPVGDYQSCNQLLVSV